MVSSPEIVINVPGDPVAYARTGGKGRLRFTPKPQRTAMSIVQVVAAEVMAGRAPLTGPLSMSITAAWCWPKSMSARKRQALGGNHRVARPDSDNIAKLICDSLNGVCYIDDSQVCELRVRKIYAQSSFTRVVIELLGEEVA